MLSSQQYCGWDLKEGSEKLQESIVNKEDHLLQIEEPLSALLIEHAKRSAINSELESCLGAVHIAMELQGSSRNSQAAQCLETTVSMMQKLNPEDLQYSADANLDLITLIRSHMG